MRRLVVLPFSKSVQMACQSLRARALRSAITTMSLVLAVAFLSYSQVGNIIIQQLAGSGDSEIVGELQALGYTGDVAAAAKQRWIVFLSLLVCVVGIINAQIMSVTERFREIGTLKCLGALDSFVVRVFVLEAGIQGLVGSIFGAIVGLLVATGTALFRFGSPVQAAFFSIEVLISFIITLAIGTGLSLIGALYPAIIAARMQPVEAMRREQ
ncbi:ABC transporter permease [Desulfotalea psychrophila]|uniref:ABC3 transporter permease C-terminal domain-containing protein n=1 Tax=Desulfotalea psychrophila (strain LSv54 / DSM 12343) TaxID=177439 RepID=Q6AME3_DESPS|nr:FtsX-like permease family protein [Desulfotalea psychrophila]CAG36482.1 hypothetical protein DP1753 [Desulfotalea psychrophila LSv54]